MRTPVPSRLIEQKRRGEHLSPDELRGFLGAYLDGEVPEYQMAAFLMAVHFRGMGSEELETLLDAMIHSGRVLDFGHLSGPVVDKHSTGGVGDKTSLVLAPLAAELGLFVPMMSGRGLGHTTGTLDKLDAIPGFSTQLSLDRFRSVVEEVGVAMIGQTEEIAPLDGRLYALRDATATVPSIPLIAASILSKKMAEGLDGLVLDVKTGAGSFLPEIGESRELARTMVGLGEGMGVRTTALLTGMDAPLGRAVGNGLETREALLCLQGEGPDDLLELSLTLVGEMLAVGGMAEEAADGAQRARVALDEGRGVERMTRLVTAQGGDARVVEDPHLLEAAPERAVVEAPASGVVQRVCPLTLGHGVVELGGGRRKMGDPVDLRVGFLVDIRPGDRIEKGAPLGEVHASTPGDLVRGREILTRAVTLGEEERSASPPPLVRERVSLGATDGS